MERADGGGASRDGRTADAVRLGLGGDEALFREYQPRLRRFFEARGFSREDALDLTQDVFQRVFRHRGTLSERGESLEAWLFGIAVNVGKNAVRDARTLKRSAPEVSLDERSEQGETREVAAPATGPSAAPNPLDRVMEKEKLAALRTAIFELPLQMRTCILLRVDRGLSYKEVAAVMRISIDTVKAHLRQAVLRLQARLGTLFELTEL